MEVQWNDCSKVANDAHVHVLSLKAEERSIQQSIDHARSTLESIAGTLGLRAQEIASAKVEIGTIADGMNELDGVVVGAKR